jgi:hypothetical protein
MHMRALIRPAVLILVTVILSAIPAGADQACAQQPGIQAKLGSFSEGSLSRPLYWVVESGGQAKLTVLVPEISCDGSASSVNFEFRDQTTQPSDFVHQNAPPIQWRNDTGHSPTYSTNVSITDDVLSVPLDPPAEYADVTLTVGTNVTVVEPSTAALIIVDDDGATSRVSLVAGAYGENETSGANTPSGGVPVFRGGNASAASTISYTLSGGSATPGSDYTGSTGTVTFAPGDRMEVIPVQVVDDAEQESTETVDVSISGDGVEDPKSVTFTITDNEELSAPTSTLHHPRQNWKYRASDYRIQEVHIFTQDVGGAGVVSAEFGLRRNMKKKNSCAWFTGKKFKKGKCDHIKWLKTGQYETDFYYIRVGELAPSTGKIKNYTAYSRAIDGAHNLETNLEVGRNDNTFEVKKPK